VASVWAVAQQQVHLVVAVKVVFVGAVAQIRTFEELNLEVGVPGGVCKRRQPVETGEDLVLNGARLDLARPADDGGYPKATFITGAFGALKLNGVIPPSGQVKTSAPLSVVKITMVSSASSMSCRCFSSAPTLSSSCAMPASSRP
jgi:hypothetical protein